jgi:hypothetical protein
LNHFILLEEWNNSAIAILMVVFLIPVLIAYLLVSAILKTIPQVQLYFGKIKKYRLWLYWVIQSGIFLALLGILIVVAYFWK